MKTLYFLVSIALFTALTHFSCESWSYPHCQLRIPDVHLSTGVNLNGYEILITADPLSALQGRKVWFDGMEAVTRFVEDFGLIVKVPDGVFGQVELKIENPDCPDILTFNFNVVDRSYFDNLETFSPPFPPEIIIPTVPSSLPTYLELAWLSADDPGYHLWFILSRDAMTGETTTFINPDSSFETATCACLRDYTISNLPYASNRIGGIVDPSHNNILIIIDRTPIGGDIEEFTGQFIDINQTVYADNRGYLNCPHPCPVYWFNPPTTGYMMLLTSRKTSKQLALFQLKI